MRDLTIKERLQHLRHREDGFMGHTHALSVTAIALILIALFPLGVTGALGTAAIPVLILAVLTATGAGNIPDLDNTTSRAKNDLGFLGQILSWAFRFSSVAVQLVLRRKKDDPTPNPHRGAWHTVPAALLLGFLVFWGTTIPATLNTEFLGFSTWGDVFAFVVSFILVYMNFSTLGKKSMDKIRKSSFLGDLVAVLVSAGATFALFYFVPDNTDFWWLGVSVAFGMFIHVLGDCFTTAGAPIFFPLTAITRKKFWWTTRFATMEAGGDTEKMVVVPILTVASLIALGFIIYQGFAGNFPGI